MTEVILAVILLLPLVSAYFWKTNGAILFFTVCASFVLVNLASSDIGNLLHRTNLTSISTDSTNLILVLAPAFLTMLLVRKTSHGQLHLILGLLSAFCAGALMVLITAPFFGSILPTSFSTSKVWSNLHRLQSWLITAGALSSFVYVWSDNFRGFRRR